MLHPTSFQIPTQTEHSGAVATSEVPFDKDGYPDFRAAGVVKAEVKIKNMRGTNADYKAANDVLGVRKTPEGFTWHHHQDGTTMQLVPSKIHAETGHTGGAAIVRSQGGK